MHLLRIVRLSFQTKHQYNPQHQVALLISLENPIDLLLILRISQIEPEMISTTGAVNH